MSRLEVRRQKRFRNLLVLYIVVFVALSIFVVTFGLRLLISGTVYLGNMFSKKDTTQETTDRFFGTIAVDTLPTATNSARLIVSGTVNQFDALDFYLNGEKVKIVDIKSAQSFSEEIGDLKSGDNTIYLIAKAPDSKKEQRTGEYVVALKNTKPRLDIDQPKDGDKTNKSEITVSGKTDTGIYIRVNGLPVVVDAQGAFATSVRLKDGENKIEVAAQDDAGNSDSKTLTITYNKDL